MFVMRCYAGCHNPQNTRKSNELTKGPIGGMRNENTTRGQYLTITIPQERKHAKHTPGKKREGIAC